MLHDVTVQGGERARGWGGQEAMSCAMSVRGRRGRGVLEGGNLESHALLLPVLWIENKACYVLSAR